MQGGLNLFGSSVARALAAAGLALAVLMWLGPLSTEARQAAGERVTPISPTLTFLPCLNKAGSKYRAKTEAPPLRPLRPRRRLRRRGQPREPRLAELGRGSRHRHQSRVRRFHLPCAKIAVQVQAFRVRKACGRRIYTRLKAVSEFGKTLVKTRACLGPA